MADLFRAEPTYRPPRPPAGGELGLSVSRLRNISHFPPADTIFKRLEKLTTSKDSPPKQSSRLPTRQELRSWVQHPDERVPMSLLRHSLDSFEGVMPRKKLAVWLQERALKQADREGHTWTPLLDTYQCTEAHHQQCPSIPNLEDRLDQLADWARQRGSAEKLEGLLEFNAHLLLVRIAELPFPFEGPRGKAWLTGVTNPKRPSARPLRYEPLLRRLRKNSHLGPQALWAIFEGAPTPLDGLHGDPWFEFAEHPAAEGEHWVYLIKEQEPTYDVFHSYLPDQAWEHPKVQEAVLYEAKGEPDSPEYQYFLLRKLVRKGGGQGQQHLTKQLFQWPETRHSAFRLIEEGFLQVDHLSSQTMSKLLGDKDPELRQKAWNLLRKRNKEQKTWEPRR